MGGSLSGEHQIFTANKETVQKTGLGLVQSWASRISRWHCNPKTSQKIWNSIWKRILLRSDHENQFEFFDRPSPLWIGLNPAADHLFAHHTALTTTLLEKLRRLGLVKAQLTEF